MALVRDVEGCPRESLASPGTAWDFVEVPAADVESPVALGGARLWRPARVPGTVGSSLAATGALSLDAGADLDASDWWFRCRFKAERAGDARVILHLPGLATVASVFVDGQMVLAAENMFHAHEVDVTEQLEAGAEHELLLRFHALGRLVATRKGRPRWRTRLVAQQQLRWFRTTLLGRMPGWNPRVAPIGPYRGVVLETRRGPGVERVDLHPRIEGNGEDGRVDVRVRLCPAPGGAPTLPRALVLQIEPPGGGARIAATLEPGGDEGGAALYAGALRIPNVARWWPHTHGPQPLYRPVLRLGEDPRAPAVALSPIGFRTVELQTADDDFGLRVNGAPLFCRGAVWTTSDILSLDDPERCRALLVRARDAGMNLLRVPGIAAYESELFYDLCDELGLLVWQEMAFANMDYPAEDLAFAANVEREADELGARLQGRPSIALFCGGSEVEQQAAMMGQPRERWTNALFERVLPEALARRCPDVPYWPNSPSGGPLPFHVNKGLAHYYGVGAYLRPLDDARRCGLRFASECLAFANVPDPETIERLLPDGESAPTHPLWKARVPRDRGVGWDFEDVRDHYVQRLFGVDPVAVRWVDPERHLALGRVATGEVMARAFAEWRRRGSTCRGALVFTYQDVWPGAGWGVIDATGRPKAAYHFLRRAFDPLALFLIDEGASGLEAHLVNDGPDAVEGELVVTLWRQGRTVVARAARTVAAPARDTAALSIDALLPTFMDSAQAYRFGPPGFDLVSARFTPHGARVLPPKRAFHFPLGLPASVDPGLTLTAIARPGAAAEAWDLTLEANAAAVAVFIEARGFEARDNYLTLAPGEPQTVGLVRAPADPRRASGAVLSGPSGTVQALNGPSAVRIVVAA